MFWDQALQIFIFGFAGVFLTLTLLVLAIFTLGKIINLFKTPKESI
jgi:Na+-transporting methylmalonyl-CoA/oxaloacetate decarboxylase gamma subunit